MKKDVPCQDNYGYYIDSQDPKKLMEFVEKFIRHNYEAVVFDSLTDLLERKKMARTERFVSEATKRLSKSKTRAIFYAENSPELASKLGKYFDKVVPISEKA
jgi:archaellum biogenesis ATPase FlaH